jgi:hypothetical protein
MKSAWFFFATLAMFFATNARADDRCNDVLANGVWQYDVNETDVHNVSAFLNWYHSGLSSVSKNKTFIVYDGDPITLGLSNDQNHNNQFFAELDTLNSGYQQYDSHIVTFVKTASSVIIKAWSDCMSENAAGIQASLKFTGDPHDILLNLTFHPLSLTPRAVVNVEVSRGAHCGEPNNQTVSVSSAVTTIVRCTRTNDNAGTIILTSSTKVVPDNSLPYGSTRFPLSGPYGSCAVVEELANGNDTYGPPEPISTEGVDIGGGGPRSTRLTLDATAGYKLTNPVKHCASNTNPCAFVVPLAEAPVTWSIPDRAVNWSPSNNSDSVTVWITGTKSKIIPGFNRVPNGTINLSYGKAFSVEFPNTALDVTLTCKANGTSRIYSLSDVSTHGEQVYLKDIRQGNTGKLYDLAVAPYDISP